MEDKTSNVATGSSSVAKAIPTRKMQLDGKVVVDAHAKNMRVGEQFHCKVFFHMPNHVKAGTHTVR